MNCVDAKGDELPSSGNVDLSLRKAAHAYANVSSIDFLQRLAAPTLPPVKCKTANSRDAASNMSIFVGVGAEPQRYFDDRTDKLACRERCRVAYIGTIRVKVARARI
jgi:hypothetical protein